MTLYYTLVFMLLVTEMVVFLLLILPLPFTIRRKMFTFISESKLVAKVQYGMKITFIFILILFIDSVNRVYRVQIELASATEKSHNGGAAIMGHERTEVQARKFYSQRNMYLCGFTLFLSLILNRTYILILDVLRLEEKIKAYETGKPDQITKAVHAASSPGEIGGLKKKIAELQKEIEKKDKQVQAMKSQAEGLHREYDALAEKYAQATGEDGSGKKDN